MSSTSARESQAVLACAFSFALCAHLGLLLLALRDQPAAVEAPTFRTSPNQAVPPAVVVALIDGDRIVSQPLVAIGAGDALGKASGSPAVAIVSAPGPAGRGVGATDGRRMWGTRAAEAALQASPWSHEYDDRIAHSGRAPRARSPEALRRAPAPGVRHHDARRERPSVGDESSQKGVPLLEEVEAADDFQGALVRPERAEAATGSVSAPAQAFAELGPRSADAELRGPVRDSASASAASSARHPDPFDLRRSLGSESGAGAGARSGAGAADRDRAWGGAASGDPGAGGWVGAELDHPYLRRLLRGLDRRIHYPRELAVRLIQGQVIVEFSLDAGGRASQVRITRSSGYPAFDDEVLRAITEGSPYGPVPAPLLAGRSSLVVRAPYRFRNPMVR